MAFKKLVRKVPPPPPVPVEDPKQLKIKLKSVHIDELIGKINALPPKPEPMPLDGCVKWDGAPFDAPLDNMHLGYIVAILPFNPISDKNNCFGAYIFHYQHVRASDQKRLIMLNEDWSPKLDEKGQFIKKTYHFSWFKYLAVCGRPAITLK